MMARFATRGSRARERRGFVVVGKRAMIHSDFPRSPGLELENPVAHSQVRKGNTCSRGTGCRVRA